MRNSPIRSRELKTLQRAGQQTCQFWSGDIGEKLADLRYEAGDLPEEVEHLRHQPGDIGDEVAWLLLNPPR